MTPAADLVRALRSRGVTLVPEGDRLRCKPADRLTPGDLDSLRTHKAAVLALLRQEPAAPKPEQPAGACGLCGTAAWVYDAGWGAWLCRTCAATPRPTLRQAFDDLTPADRQRLDAEAAQGDGLAGTVLELLTQPASDTGPAFPSGGEPVGWLLYSRRLDRELWVARDADAAATLPADSLPVVLADELQRLRGLDDTTLRAVLDSKCVFPEARVVPPPPEPRGMR